MVRRRANVGDEVGYVVRFEDRSSHRTTIKYATEGILLREALEDGDLSGYGVVVLDEAHERTLNFDVLIGLAKGIQRRRSTRGGDRATTRKGARPLKLVVMSATLEAKKFCDYLGCRMLEVPGRAHPVETLYAAAPQDDYLEAAVCATMQVHAEEPPGDVLVFLTGQEEIENAQAMLADHAKALPSTAPALVVVALYAAMPPEVQMRAFERAPEGSRKVILSTNIAETSLTIDGVRYVIDAGFVKLRRYNPSKCSDSLQVTPVSRAQARQRAGRAGRQGPGKAFHLFPESEFFKLAPAAVPEIARTNLANMLLQMKAMGIEDAMAFDFLDKPPRMAMMRAFELLLTLGALGSDGAITEEGRGMARLSVDPVFAKVVLASMRSQCPASILQIVALLSVESLLHFPRGKVQDAHRAHAKFMSEKGDLLTLLAIFRAFRKAKQKARRAWCSDHFINFRALSKAADIHRQLSRQVTKLHGKDAAGGPGADETEREEDVLRCLALGLFFNAAQKEPDGTYRVLTSGQKVSLHPTSGLFHAKPEFVTFVELVHTSKMYARSVIAVDAQHLITMLPEVFGAE